MTEGEHIEQLPGFRSHFEHSPHFQPFVDRVHGLLESHTPVSAHAFMESFTGSLFEELAYVGLLRSISSKFLLLSPQETIEYFTKLYPKVALRQLGLQITLSDEYVPDGLLFGKDGKVKRILEYSTQGIESQLVKYMQSKARHVGHLRKRFPHIFGETELVVMFTHDVHQTLIREGGKPRGVTLQPVPITSHHVHQYAHQLARRHFPATLHPHAPQA